MFTKLIMATSPATEVSVLWQRIADGESRECVDMIRMVLDHGPVERLDIKSYSGTNYEEVSMEGSQEIQTVLEGTSVENPVEELCIGTELSIHQTQLILKNM